MPISAGSPAINAGTTGAGIPTDDQRGFPRDASADIGATEFQTAHTTSSLTESNASIGDSINLNVFSDYENATFQWYLGQTGDTSSPIGGASNSDFSTPNLPNSEEYWVRITSGGTDYDSDTLTVEVRATYEQWADFYGLTGSDRDLDAILANDGMSNLEKFALGLNPTIPDSWSNHLTYVLDFDLNTFSLSCDLSKLPLDASFEFLTSTDLSTWTSGEITSQKTGESLNSETWEGTRNLDPDKTFLKINIIKD